VPHAHRLQSIGSTHLARVFLFLGALLVSLFGLQPASGAELISARPGDPALNVASNGGSNSPAISADGDLVLFQTNATNMLGEGSTPGIYSHRLSTGETKFIVTGALGRKALSDDGRYLVYARSFDGSRHIIRRDLLTGAEIVATEGYDASSWFPSMSGDGRFIVFKSDADLLTGTGSGLTEEGVFVYDAADGSLVSAVPEGLTDLGIPTISGNGRYVLYTVTFASNIARANGLSNGHFIYNTQTGSITSIDTYNSNGSLVIDNGTLIGHSIFRAQSVLIDIASGSTEIIDGQIEAISNDGSTAILEVGTFDGPLQPTGNRYDYYHYDIASQERTLITNWATNALHSTKLSADGSAWLFSTGALTVPVAQDNNLFELNRNNQDVYLWRHADDSYQRISQTSGSGFTTSGEGDSWAAKISDDGNRLIFSSDAPDLVLDDNNSARDIFYVDRLAGTTERLSAGGNGDSLNPQLSKDGTFVAWQTRATNLTSGFGSEDTNAVADDILLQELSSGNRVLVTSGADGASNSPSISADGRYLTFASLASNLADGDSNGTMSDVYLFDRLSSNITLITKGGDSDSVAPSISGDGRYVTFISRATNLVADSPFTCRLYLYDREADTTECLNPDIFLSLDFSRPIISSDGRYVAVHSRGFSLRVGYTTATLYLFDRTTNERTNLNDGHSRDFFLPGEFSSDGKLLIFSSHANTLVTPDANGFVRDIYTYNLETREFARVFNGAEADSGGPTINRDGSVVAFDTGASNIAEENNGDYSDVFLIDNRVSNSSPIATPLVVQVEEDGVVAITLMGTDPEGDALTFNLLSSTANGVLTGTPPELSYRPAANFHGSDSFEYSVADGVSSNASAVVDISILPVNDPPIAISQTIQAVAGEPLQITLAASDIDSTTLSYSAVEGPMHGTLSTSAGAIGSQLLYTSDGGFTGVDSFRYLVTDGELSSEVEVIRIEVSAPASGSNSAPIAQDLTVDLALGSGQFVLPAEDSDGDALTYRITVPPIHGALSGTAPELTYIANSGFVGVDQLTYTVSDGQQDSNEAVVRFLSGTPTLALAVLPTSRSVRVGTTATVFATVLNASSIVAESCAVVLQNNPGVSFEYQLTNEENQLMPDGLNAAFDITAQGAVTFVFRVTATQVTQATSLEFDVLCSRGSGPLRIDGVNTLLFSSDTVEAADILAIAATVENDGIMHIPRVLPNSTGVAGVAAVNIGAAGQLSVTPRATQAADLALLICPTDPTTGACDADPSPSVAVPFGSQVVRTFSIFATSGEPLTLDPASKRIFIEFYDAAGSLRGSTSIAVEGGG